MKIDVQFFKKLDYLFFSNYLFFIRIHKIFE